MLRRALVLLLCSFFVGCSFKTDRSLGTGELKGRLVFQSADGNKVPAASASVQLQGTRLAVKADAQGQFVVRGLPAATYSLKVAYNTSATDPTAGGGLVLPRIDLSADNGLSRDLGTVVLQRLATLDGLVRMNGEPLPNARVVVPTIGQRYSGTAGAFSFDGLFAVQSDNAEDAPSVAAFVQLENGTVVAQKTFTLSPGAHTSVTIDVDPNAALLPPTTVSGSARLTDGGDTTDVTVVLYAEGTSTAVADATVSSDGLFVLTNVPVGVYTVVVHKEGYGDVEYPFVVVAGEPLSLPDFVLSKSTGSVCGADGTPVTGDVCDLPVPPRVTEVLPADGAKDVAINTTMLSVKFSKEIDPKSATTTSVTLGTMDGTPVPGKVTVFQTAVMFEPTVPLDYDTHYVFEISPAIRATDGTAVTSALRFSFTTVAISTFSVLSSSPAKDPMEMDFPLDGTITMSFSQRIDATTAVSPNVRLYLNEAAELPCKVEVNGTHLTVQPLQALTPAALYILTVSTGLKSTTGKGLDSDYTVYFNAIDEREFKITGSTPSDGAVDVTVPIFTVDASFSGRIDPLVGVQDVVLTDSTGALVSGKVTVGYDSLSYYVSEGLQLKTNYKLTFNPTFKAANGRTLTGAQSISFRTAEFPPLSFTQFPSGGSTTASTTAVFAGFSQPMDPQSFTTSTFYVTDDQNNVVPSVVSYIAQTDTAVVSLQMKYQTHYTATLAGSVKTAQGDTLGTDRSWDFTTMPQPVARSVAAGSDHTCMVLTDNRLWCFGQNSSGELGVGNTATLTGPVPLLNEWKTVAVGTTHTCALDNADQISCWGDTYSGQVGNGAPTETPGQSLYPTRLAGQWQSLTAGGDHSCAIRNDGIFAGTLWCWGSNLTMESGQTTNYAETPMQVGADADWAQVSAGGAHTCALKSNHTLWCFGESSDGRLGGFNQTPQSTPLQVTGSWKAVSAGGAHTCAIDVTDALWCWGRNDTGQLGISSQQGPPFVYSPTAVTLPGGSAILSVSAGEQHTCAIDGTNTLFCWGANGMGQLGDGSQVAATVPRQVSNDQWSLVSASVGHTCGVNLTQQKTQCWGSNDNGTNGNGFLDTLQAVPFAVPAKAGSWTKMAVGGQHTCAIGSDQSLWCWGSNVNSQLGDGTQFDKQTPQRIGTDTDWTEIAAAGDTTCGLRTSGADTTLWCWGENSSKRVGIDSSGAPVSAPTQIGTDTDFVSVAMSITHTCAVRAGSSVRCWGWNAAGQLGLGYFDVINQQTYASTTSIAPWTNAILGASFSCFMGSAGSASCVGTNMKGELGRGFFTTVPPNQNGGAELSLVAAAGGISFAKITAGGGFVCGLTTTGDAGCWGSNLRGAVGSGLLDVNSLPANANTMTMLPDSGWLEIGAGYSHACGVKNIDELWCWGSNEYGQLGDPSLPHGSGSADVMTPHLVLSGAAFTTIKGGFNHTCALKGDGSMWCWGSNEYGQTGYGHLWEQVPVDVVAAK